MRRLLLAVTFVFAAVRMATAEPTRVSFPGPDGIMLVGVLFEPPSPGPHPAVVALHGCGGLYRSTGGLTARHADWGERLAADGFVVLLPDSFGPRGLGSQCRVTERTVRPRRERLADAVAAKTWLQSRPTIDPKAVSLLGWSNGGSTVLYAAMPSAKPEGHPDFARAVAFYPGCEEPQQRGWTTRLPILILIGEQDDWSPAAPCRQLVEGAKGRGEAAEIVVYPGAYHEFDAPNMRITTSHGLAYTADGSGIAHEGTDPAGRADAIVRVPAFLAR